MTTARAIITGSLTFRLNKLSPGETLDADTAATCLAGLNHIVDEVDGAKGSLFREILTAGTVTAATGALGTTWATLSPGDQILGATYNDGSNDIVLDPLTMEQYHALPVKTQAGDPLYFAHDGAATIYFYPVPTSRSVTLRTRETVADFADLDTDYVMPKGYESFFSALLAELMAPVLTGGISVALVRAASAARRRMVTQNLNPAIVNGTGREWNIYQGWV
jgi:hypothetical protein